MVEITLKVNVSSEISQEFLQGMVDRMAMSFYKYGAVVHAYPHLVNALESLHVRLNKYQQTGNTEFLMDVANFAMIEYMLPKHPDAHFEAQDSRTSPGRIWNGETTPVSDNNTLSGGD